MNSVACPHCGAANNPQQSKWNYCEKCGGRLPGAVMPAEPATPRSAGAVSSSTATLARPRAQSTLANYQSTRGAISSPASTPPRTRPHPLAYVIIAISIAVCAGVIVAINNGKADYVWIGCGLGAGLGAFISQLLGYWPKKITR